MRWLRLAALLLMPLPALAAERCDTCVLPNGVYHTVAPPDWDGVSPLRLLLFLHGWRGKGTDITGDPNIAGVASKLGFLLVAPDGEADAADAGGTSWSHVGSPHHGRDDVAFLRAVVADAEQRWPIDRGTVVAGGFSIGGSMVWDLACYAAPSFTAFIPFSGGFWEPLPDACTSGPVALRHTHGLHDHVVPMAGRSILGGRFRQGDILLGMARWRAEDACKAEPDSAAPDSGLTCTRWTSCTAGGELALCLHDGDHILSAPMLEASLRWAIHAKPATPAKP